MGHSTNRSCCYQILHHHFHHRTCGQAGNPKSGQSLMNCCRWTTFTAHAFTGWCARRLTPAPAPAPSQGHRPSLFRPTPQASLAAERAQAFDPQTRDLSFDMQGRIADSGQGELVGTGVEPGHSASARNWNSWARHRAGISAVDRRPPTPTATRSGFNGRLSAATSGFSLPASIRSVDRRH